MTVFDQRAISIASTRRHEAVTFLASRKAAMQEQIDLGHWNPDGSISDYKISNIANLKAEIEHVDAEIADLEQLEDEDLVRRFYPQAFPPDEDPPTLQDVLEITGGRPHSAFSICAP